MQVSTFEPPPVDQELNTTSHYYTCQSCQALSESNGTCKQCGSTSHWISLADDFVARRLQELDLEERSNISPPVWVRLTSWVFAILVFAMLMLLICGGGGLLLDVLLGLSTKCASGESCSWFRELAEFLGFLTIFVPGVSAGVALYGRKRLQKRLTRRFFRPKNEAPLRQLGALPPTSGAKATEVLEGTATAQGPLLQSPFSGEPCIAYHTKVFLHLPEALIQKVWLLNENQSTSFSVKQRQFHEAGCTVVREVESCVVTRSTCPAHFVAFLRERGLFFDENAISIQESIIRNGEEVSILETGESLLLTTPSLASKIGQLSMAQDSSEEGQLSLASGEGQLSLSLPGL